MREQRFLILTFVVVALVGGPAVYSVMREPALRLQTELKVPVNRKPAQVSHAEISNEVSEQTPRNAIKAKSVTLEMGCQRENQTQETDGTLLRLKSDCWKESAQKISVINKTNGFTAAVIETKSKGFTTDFIDLKEGDNNLEISGTDGAGLPILKLVIVKRRLPASEISAQNN